MIRREVFAGTAAIPPLAFPAVAAAALPSVANTSIDPAVEAAAQLDCRHHG